MSFVSHFELDWERRAEWIVGFWQGEIPDSLQIDRYMYLAGPPGTRRILLIWDGDEDARACMERIFGRFGTFDIVEAVNHTPGILAAFARDIDLMRERLTSRGLPPEEVDAQIELRRIGLEAPDDASAIEAARRWGAEHALSG